ncbi:Hsp70 family protein [Crocosphaera watsonii]|uniref:Chaperone protein DnaK n=1 Tax=Crocosphaera watsonii WH 0401 TaxID=555881 RepID=T2JB22_CROWT|nr:Hsp70 family protein [Crocosphaera watsonii]CCQ63063.1 Chaperone protein DnaK [Crocosphaera watsonii WH 0401]
MIEQSRPNFFLLLELDPKTPWSESEFQQFLKHKKAEWTKKSKNTKYRAKYVAYLDMVSNIQEVIKNPNSRQIEANYANQQTNKKVEEINDPTQLEQSTNHIQSTIKEESKMSEKNVIFGIDLGTTYSCIAYVDQYGRPTVITNMEGDRTTPSVVQFNGEERIVGKEAKDSSMLEPDNTVDMVKRFMGKEGFNFEHEGKSYPPEEISSYILRKMVEDAQQQTGLTITDVVITCPAYFGIPERDATKFAGEIAGLNVRSIINEPTAAAIFYGVNEEADQTVLVYDLGGGTFDITVIKIEGGNITVICTNGDDDLGGKNWDEKIVTYLAQQWQEETGSSEDPLDSPETLQDLYVSAEKAKKTLTSKTETSILVFHEMQRQKITLTREIFDELTESLLTNTIELTNIAIAEAKKRGIEDFDQILMVGGSTKMPQVARRLQEQFGKEPKFCEPDEAVAKGAAVYGHKLMLDQEIIIKISEELGVKPEEVKIEDVEQEIVEKAQGNVADDLGLQLGAVQTATDTKITNVASKSFGIKAFVKNEEKLVNLIIQNDTVPADVTQRFGTAEANQTSVELIIAENRSTDQYYELSSSQEIGQAEITLPPGLPQGTPIDVTFKVDEQGMLNMYAKELSTGRDATITIKTEGGITEEEKEEIKARQTGLVFS